MLFCFINTHTTIACYKLRAANFFVQNLVWFLPCNRKIFPSRKFAALLCGYSICVSFSSIEMEVVSVLMPEECCVIHVSFNTNALSKEIRIFWGYVWLVPLWIVVSSPWQLYWYKLVLCDYHRYIHIYLYVCVCSFSMVIVFIWCALLHELWSHAGAFDSFCLDFTFRACLFHCHSNVYMFTTFCLSPLCDCVYVIPISNINWYNDQLCVHRFRFTGVVSRGQRMHGYWATFFFSDVCVIN